MEQEFSQFISNQRVLRLRVTPKASSNRIVIDRHEDGSSLLRVYVTSVPEDGKANKAVIEALSAYLKIPKSRITIAKGQTGRDKIVEILVKKL